MTRTIGSSSVAAILGISPWATPMSVWADLVGLTERTDNSTAATRRGQMLEGAIRDEHARRLGVVITPGPRYEDAPNVAPAPNDWAHYREDGSHEESDGIWIDEIKTVRQFDDSWGDDGSAEIPAYYDCQLLWQGGLARLRGINVVGGYLPAFCPMTDEMRTYRKPFNTAQFATMFEIVGDWYKAHVIGNVPPPVDGSEATRKVLAKLYPGNVEKVTLDATASDLADKALIIAADNEIATIEISRDAAKNRLMERIGKANATHIRGVCAWSPTKGRTSFDSKAALAADPSLSRFQTVGEPSRRFTLTEK